MTVLPCQNPRAGQASLGNSRYPRTFAHPSSRIRTLGYPEIGR